MERVVWGIIIIIYYNIIMGWEKYEEDMICGRALSYIKS